MRKLLAIEQKTIILVTSAFHMRRARQIFEREGFDVLPYPVNTRVAAEQLTPMSFLPNPAALTATHTALRELLGRLYYQLKHEIKPQ